MPPPSAIAHRNHRNNTLSQPIHYLFTSASSVIMPLLSLVKIQLVGCLIIWLASTTTSILFFGVALVVVVPSCYSFSVPPATTTTNHRYHYGQQHPSSHHRDITANSPVARANNFAIGHNNCNSSRSSIRILYTAPSHTGDMIIANRRRLETLAQIANNALERHGEDIFKPFHARVGVIGSHAEDGDFQQRYLRLGLLATESYTRNNNNIKDEYTVAAMPYYDIDGSGLCLAPHMATQLVFKDLLPEGYDGWTGDVGLLAMLLLNEMARSSSSSNKSSSSSSSSREAAGIDSPKRKEGIQSLMSAWISVLPSPKEMEMMHPLLWDEDDQEKLQSSSTKKIYRLLDDIDDDSSWLNERVWSLDRTTFPETVSIRVGSEEGEDGRREAVAVEERPCFSPRGFRYAVSLVRSRSFFVDDALRLLPFLDFANHDDYDSLELKGGTTTLGNMMLWGGSAKGVLLKSGKSSITKGEEIRISYGPKGPADYLLDHGFVPPMCRVGGGSGGKKGRGVGLLGSAITSELSFEVDDSDRFRDDKLDILEYETYDLAPMEPLQTFDVTGGPGSTGEPDPAMIQFLRLVKLGGKDAFLLESIFRKEIWGFMSEPVSEANERGAVTAVIDACQNALSDMMEDGSTDDGGDGDKAEKEQLCSMVRESERQALSRTLVYMQQEATALDLKEYYQERRLKSLGLDSEWTPEDDMGYGATRVPGGADYDW